jgi:hypothetical protein
MNLDPFLVQLSNEHARSPARAKTSGGFEPAFSNLSVGEKSGKHQAFRLEIIRAMVESHARVRAAYMNADPPEDSKDAAVLVLKDIFIYARAHDLDARLLLREAAYDYTSDQEDEEEEYAGVKED